jgi:prevent-host-death family protein
MMYEKPASGTRKVGEAAAAYVAGADVETVPAAEFKAQCLRLIEKVRQGRGEVVVTRYGRPVARMVPYDPAPPSIFGHLSGTVLSQDDLVSPVDADWEADA